MAERGVETTIFTDSVEGFLEKNWPFGEPLPATSKWASWSTTPASRADSSTSGAASSSPGS